MTKPRHPEIGVAMFGMPDSTVAIIGRCRLAMRRASLPTEELEAFTEEATASGDSLLRTVKAWFEVDGGEVYRILNPKAAK